MRAEAAEQARQTVDLLLRGGQVMDGTGQAARRQTSRFTKGESRLSANSRTWRQPG